MKKLLLLCIIALLTACAGVPRPTTANQQSAGPPPYEAWTRVLQKFVDDQGRVNFKQLAQDRADLDQFVAYIYDFGPNNHAPSFPTRNHVLAYHLNAYNALAMHKVLAAGIPESLSGLKKVSFFAFGKVQVGGQAMSLYDYENKVIRPLGEARVHMALNCMVISCPRLPKTAFLAEQLEQQLQQETHYFVSEARNVTVDSNNQALRLSEIFQFYTADFLQSAPSLAAWVNRYRTSPVPENYTVTFTPYDWGINSQTRSQPSSQPRN